jgi:hypothetical protein
MHYVIFHNEWFMIRTPAATIDPENGLPNHRRFGIKTGFQTSPWDESIAYSRPSTEIGRPSTC